MIGRFGATPAPGTGGNRRIAAIPDYGITSELVACHHQSARARRWRDLQAIFIQGRPDGDYGASACGRWTVRRRPLPPRPGAVVQRGLVTIDPFFVFSRRTVRCSGSARAGEDAVPGVMKWRRKHTVVGDIIQFINPS